MTSLRRLFPLGVVALVSVVAPLGATAQTPDSPTDVTLTASKDSFELQPLDAVLAWNYIGAAQFEVERRVGSTADYEAVTSGVEGAGPAYKVTDPDAIPVATGTACYRVRAITDEGASDWVEDCLEMATTQPPAYPPPVDFALRAFKLNAELAPLSIEGTWSYEHDVTFEVWRLYLEQFADADVQPDEAWEQLSLQVEHDGTGYSFTDADAWNISSDPPCYRVRVVDGANTYGWATECIPHPPSSGGGAPSPTPGAPVVGTGLPQSGGSAAEMSVVAGLMALAGGLALLATRRRLR